MCLRLMGVKYYKIRHGALYLIKHFCSFQRKRRRKKSFQLVSRKDQDQDHFILYVIFSISFRTRTRTILYYMWYSVYHSVHRLSFNEIYGVNMSLMIFKMIYCPYSELNRYIWSNTPLRLQDHDSSEAKDWMVRSWTGYFEVFICLKNYFAKIIF